MAPLTFVVLAAAPALDLPLSEEQAVAVALRQNPRLRQQGHAVDEAVALTEAGLAWNNPLLRIGGVRYDDIASSDRPLAHATVGVRWSPPGLGQRTARRADGEAHEAEARMQLVLARRQTTARVRTLHAEILSLDAQLALLREVVAQREQLRLLVERRLELQAATAVEHSLAEVDELEARTLLGELTIRRRAARDELLIELGLDAGTELTLAAAPTTCVAPADVAALATRAQAANPRRSVVRAELAAVTAERRQRGLERWPWLDYVQLAYGFTGPRRADFVALQLQLTLPLLDQKGPHRRALVAREQALTEAAAVDERVLGERVLRLAATQAEQAALMARYRDAAAVVERAVAELRAALAAAGPTRLAEVVALQARLLTTQRAYLRAQLDCHVQQIELDQLTNGDGDEPSPSRERSGP